MTRVRAALYLDFDNVFGGLIKLDPEVALRFAEDPAGWLARLSEELTIDGPRRWLVLRCYLNPAGSVPHPQPEAGQQRLFFSKFRPNFTRAGFDVIDCPRLSHTKNAADIRLVMDAMDSLAAETRYDEFVIASGDSDMTPLLVRLRAEDRRTTVVSPSDAAAAFTAVADRFIDSEQVLALVQGETAEDEPPLAHPATRVAPDDESAEQLAARLVAEAYAVATAPVNLATLAAAIRRALADAGDGSVITETSWFNRGSFGSYLDALGLDGFARSTHYLWDVRRHQAPEPIVGNQPGLQVPTPVARLGSLLNLPGLPSDQWPEIYAVLSEFAASHPYNLTEATKWGRDQLAARGSDVGRRAVVAVVTGATHGGCPLFREPPPTADEIGRAFVDNAIARAAAADLALSPEDESVVRRWLRPST